MFLYLNKYNYHYDGLHICIVVIIHILKLAINIFGTSSNNFEHKIDTSLFVQKPYLGTNYIESNIEQGIDLKNQYRIKSLPNPITIREPASKNYVDKLFNDPSIKKTTLI